MEIKKILIANRGEIALRVIRTCKEMGIKTVALCPRQGDEDNFLETKFADEFYYLEQDGILGYLDQRKIIEIAKRAEATAIHPGYGFLSENWDFARFCERNNIKFIGPSSETLRQLGNKVEAKKIAKQSGCPILSGTQPIKNEAECMQAVNAVGAPFLFKASNSGGGLGIQLISEINKNGILSAFQRIKRETKNAFGDDEIFIEKFLENPRHIEFQILGDGKGNVVHFGERECSIQRRHQKLIEEAPSCFLDERLRQKMGDMAVKIGKLVNYESLGTVEFLLDENKNFYFLEVNPRLQVEHPVTEQICGVDLVEQQIRIANGESLNLKQRDIKLSGWAMEFRICAEDALNNFQPNSGTITQYLPPNGRGVEMHSFCRDGQCVFPYFDSMIGKLVVYGKDRPSVIRQAKRSFDEFVLNGVPTLIPFYKIILERKNFSDGNFSTSFIKQEKIIELLREAQPRLQRKEIKINNNVVSGNNGKFEKISKQDIAWIVAKLYHKIKKQASKETKTNGSKWLAVTRSEALQKF